ncbi:MAG: rhodanese-like domain-containing protein [Pyrinomonadaceae bacterium]
MRRELFFFLISAAAVSACSTETSQNNAPAARTEATPVVVTAPAARPETPGAASAPVARPVEAARISLEEAKKEFDAGTAVMIDVRAADVYNAERIKGAISMPYETLDANISKLPKGKKLIVYCS